MVVVRGRICISLGTCKYIPDHDGITWCLLEDIITACIQTKVKLAIIVTANDLMGVYNTILVSV